MNYVTAQESGGTHLQFMRLDVLPQGVYYDRSGLRMNTQQSGESGVEFELQWLVIE